MREVYIDCGITQNRAGIFDDGKLVDLYLENVDDTNISGNIYKGRIENIVEGLNAAFVNIGSNKNAMLHFDNKIDIRKIKRGDEVLVQVIREPSRDKGARVTLDISLAGKYMVFLPGGRDISISRKINSEEIRNKIINEMTEILEDGYGLILRTESVNTDIEELSKEYCSLRNIWNEIKQHSSYIKAPRIIYDFRNLYNYLLREFIGNDVEKVYINRESDIEYLNTLLQTYGMNVEVLYDKFNFIFMDKIEKEITNLLKRKVELPSGGFIYVEKTEAMIVFDVNSGSFINTRNKNETILKTNVQAGCVISRLIRLCNFSGIIIVDFIDMEDEKSKEYLLQSLKNELKKDRLPVMLYGFTNLGLMEISRPRKGKTIYETLYKDYFKRELSVSYLLKSIENRCLRYYIQRNINKFNITVQKSLLSVNNELLKYFKQEMLRSYNISIDYIYLDALSGIEISIT